MFKRISELLALRNISQKDMADAVGVSTGNVSDWKSGRAQPKTDVLIRIAEFFDVSLDYLTGRTDIQSTKLMEDTYRVGVETWLTDKAFSGSESDALKRHYLELLLRYKNALNALSNYAHSGNRPDDLEASAISAAEAIQEEVRQLAGWVAAMPFYFAKAGANTAEDSTDLINHVDNIAGVSNGDAEFLTDEERDLITIFRSLNKSSKRIVMGAVENERRLGKNEQGDTEDVG